MDKETFLASIELLLKEGRAFNFSFNKYGNSEYVSVNVNNIEKKTDIIA